MPVGYKAIKQGIHDQQMSMIGQRLLLENQEHHGTKAIQKTLLLEWGTTIKNCWQVTDLETGVWVSDWLCIISAVDQNFSKWNSLISALETVIASLAKLWVLNTALQHNWNSQTLFAHSPPLRRGAGTLLQTHTKPHKANHQVTHQIQFSLPHGCQALSFDPESSSNKITSIKQ